MQYQLKARQVCLIIIAFFPILKIFTLPSLLAGFSNEDMWISAIILLLIDFVSILFILNIIKRSNLTFFELLEENFGKGITTFILILYFLFFMLKAVIPFNEQKDYVELTLYTLMPSKLYFLPMLLVCFYLCTKKIRVLGRASDVLWIFTILGIGILFFLSLPNSDFGAILPIFANPFNKILKGSISSISWFCDAPYLLFLIGNFKADKKDRIKILLSFLLSALLILLFLITFYAVFTSISFRQRFALTEISKYSAVINNIGRFDYLGIVLILFVNVFSLSLPIYFSCHILNYIFKFKKTFIAPLITVGIQFIILVGFMQFYLTIENFIMNYLGIFFLIVGNLFPILTIFLKKQGEKHENFVKG